MLEKKITVKLENICKRFDGVDVVKNLNLEIEQGEFLTLLGPSGCGKTTTLRMIAGFEHAESGEIFLDGENMRGKKPNMRDVNTVFQNYALFPHMNVYDNIAFGLVEKKIDKYEIKQRVTDVLKMVRLEGMEKRMPGQMSGGQKQRVAIARALINRPKVLLLDEPLGALDLKLRKQMQYEIKSLQRQLGITFVYVTHDQEEALTMSDRIGVMNNGVLEQVGTPQEIYNHPKTKFVANFIGESNILESYVDEIGESEINILMESGSFTLPSADVILEEMIYVCVRPENMKMSKEPVDGFDIKGMIKEHIFVGSATNTVIELANGQKVRASSSPEVELPDEGSAVNLYWNPKKCVILHTHEEQIYNVIENSEEKTAEELGLEGGLFD